MEMVQESLQGGSAGSEMWSGDIPNLTQISSRIKVSSQARVIHGRVEESVVDTRPRSASGFQQRVINDKLRLGSGFQQSVVRSKSG